jgi:thiamine-phosphate pyrophosphorylase
MPHRQAYPDNLSRPKKPHRDLPRIWLMTDPRYGAHLLRAIQALPHGSGVIFRHYDLSAGDRMRLFQAVRRICRRRGHRLLLAKPIETARYIDVDGWHNSFGSKAGIRSASVHNMRELRAAYRQNADLILLSPVRKTATHPDAAVLGANGLRRIASAARSPIAIIALGGMNRQNAAIYGGRIINGWAAIDAFRI